jgi:signal peptidase I
MLPTLKPGATFSYKQYGAATDINRGDLVIFLGGQAPKVRLVSRLIGLPGDRVQMRGGALFLNDMAVPRVRIEDYVDSTSNSRVAQWRETLANGVVYATLDVRQDGFYDNTPVHSVPSGSYFVVSDNRDHATDSRALNQVGYIPLGEILGRVVRVQ